MSQARKRKIKLFKGIPDMNPVQQSNVANVRSRVLEFEPPADTFFGLANVIVPVIDLRDSAGNQIDSDSVVYIGKKRAADTSPAFAPGSFDLHDFNDLSTNDQRKAENRARDGTLAKDLGASMVIREEERLLVEIESEDVIDWDNSTFEFWVDYGGAT